ncbi:MAG: Cell wall-associated protease precursor [Syntrophus sp. PtaU1.Bin005]|jgi:subtilisin family serine protease|uniref:S8 family peptidase n=1 Tax=Syntrophus buswellii TaxID=43774 RepID=UPI0009D1ABF8|nr:MAG: Cell wall-associated protease precursor [Syntrophus sp. PtaB.Bin138]OPY81345.1 MAG: Cell wall-associated protease precursor [Syntrophus sp. PtaU1.Bin005]
MQEKKGKGFLLGGPAGTGANGPQEGDIRLRDERGNWHVVQGIPLYPPLYTDRSATIAVIDSGILADHPQIRGLIAEQEDFTGEGPEDRIGHGTIVAILTLQARSAAPPEFQNLPSPRILVAKVADADGTVDKHAVISAIDWAASRGAGVVNLSLGFIEGTDDYSDLCSAITKHPEVLFVAAAGNYGPDVRVYPAACAQDGAANIISVGTTDDWSGKGDIQAPGTVTLKPLEP